MLTVKRSDVETVQWFYISPHGMEDPQLALYIQSPPPINYIHSVLSVINVCHLRRRAGTTSSWIAAMSPGSQHRARPIAGVQKVFLKHY